MKTLERLQHRCCTMNNAKFFRTPILENTCEWLLLQLFLKTPLEEYSFESRQPKARIFLKKLKPYSRDIFRTLTNIKDGAYCENV